MVQFLGNRYVPKTDLTHGTPVTVYKRAHLKIHPTTGELLIVPLVHSLEGISVNQDAACKSALFHKAPFRACTCGFYGYTSHTEASSHPQGGNIILKVIASGKMFQYSKGYRYQHQRVEQVEVSKCDWCSNPAIRFAVTTPQQFLFPMCRAHVSTTGMRTIRFDELETLASNTLPSNAPKITIKAQEYESTANTLKHLAKTYQLKRILTASAAGLAAGIVARLYQSQK